MSGGISIQDIGDPIGIGGFQLEFDFTRREPLRSAVEKIINASTRFGREECGDEPSKISNGREKGGLASIIIDFSRATAIFTQQPSEIS